MSVDVLWVEGNLDVEVVGWVLESRDLAIRRGGSKNDLPKRVRWDREAVPARKRSYFLRDRDFREPELGRTEPVEERMGQGAELMGWHWCRHDIESYLIEPRLLVEVLKKTPAEVEEALIQAANEIRYFVAARWVVGSLRPNVPFNYELETGPPELGEYQLPAATDRRSQESWCRDHLTAFRQRAQEAVSFERVETAIDRHFEFFDTEALVSVEAVLYWFPGKNLLPSLAKKVGLPGGAGDLLPKLKTRIARNPQLLANLPEFQNLQRRMTEV